VDDFCARLDIREALRLYMFLEAREDELSEGVDGLYSRLRTYLYENLSIQDLEQPEKFLQKLDMD
jgi:hypothetical protein